MTKKRIIAFAAAIILLIGVSSAVASTTAGTASDPLISLQYITNTYIPQLLTSGREMIQTALGNNGGSGTTGSFSVTSLSSGSTVTLGTGGSVVLNSGSASLSIVSGTVVNVTRGEEVKAGPINLCERYMAVEDTIAVVSATSACELAYDGDAVINGSTVEVSFSDVPAGHWAFSYIEKLASAGYINGTGNGKFSPGSNMTRADFVTILGRAAGVSVSAYQTSSFTDVAVGAYYAPYVEWAVKAGIVTGMGDGTFAPGSNITRSQMAAIAVRYAQYVGITLSNSGNTALFPDDASIESWAKDSVYAARNAGIITGRTDGSFDPKGNANRAEVSAVICRLLFGS